METAEKGALALLHLKNMQPPPHRSREVPARVQNAHLALFGQNAPTAVSGGGDSRMFSVAAGIGS